MSVKSKKKKRIQWYERKGRSHQQASKLFKNKKTKKHFGKVGKFNIC